MKSLFASVFFSILFASSALFAQSSVTLPGVGKYQVVVNHEEQYSIIPAKRETFPGWHREGKVGSYKVCAAYIKEVWTDMRPLSVQKMNLPNDTRYGVVINHEEQYSIWPLKMDLPKGYRTTKYKGSLKACTKYIEEVWTDMRPLSLRK